MPTGETDHDILIELRTDTKWIKETTDKQLADTKKLIRNVAVDLAKCRSGMDPRVSAIEKTISNLKGKWSAISALIGAVVAALILVFTYS